MSRVCDLTGKSALNGYNVPKSKKRTKKRFQVNLQYKNITVPGFDKPIRLRVSTSVLRTIDKIGIESFLKKQAKKGIISL
ncbi:MAG: 50S ribosomal protein L28 [Solitalea-like symbiont of Tyrophagus putrescentiae]